MGIAGTGQPDENDQAVFAHIQAGDEAALARLFSRHADRLLRVANAVLHDWDAASDAVQDLFVGIWSSRERIELPVDVGKYLRRAVRNRALKLIALDDTAARTRRALGEEARAAFAVNDAPRDLSVADREAAISRALVVLQPRTREIFLLARTGLGSGEIADLLGVSAATVYNQLSRALKLLAGELMGWDT